MHVIEQFSASVFVYDLHGPVERVDQVPVPVMEVDADVFAEVADSVLHVQMVGSVIVGYFNGRLSQKRVRFYGRPVSVVHA